MSECCLPDCCCCCLLCACTFAKSTGPNDDGNETFAHDDHGHHLTPSTHLSFLVVRAAQDYKLIHLLLHTPVLKIPLLLLHPTTFCAISGVRSLIICCITIFCGNIRALNLHAWNRSTKIYEHIFVRRIQWCRAQANLTVVVPPVGRSLTENKHRIYFASFIRINQFNSKSRQLSVTYIIVQTGSV